jgi:hypothetical protein
MRLLAIRVLTGVRLLVIEVLDEAVVPTSKRATKKRADPVDPVIVGKLCTSDSGTEAASGVERAASVVDTYSWSVNLFRIRLRWRFTYRPS